MLKDKLLILAWILIFISTILNSVLINVANLCAVEFIAPTHSNPHFTPTDDANHCKEK